MMVEVEQVFVGILSVEVSVELVNIVDWLVDIKIEFFKCQVCEDVKNGVICVNGEKVIDFEVIFDFIVKFDGKYVVIWCGKKNYILVKVYVQVFLRI